MSLYDALNPQQKEAVLCTDGPLLLLAGAGSGKTRVLIHRIAYLIEEKGINPWNILAITFTNKAAGEMRERVDHMLGYGSENVWVSTFHSLCVRILRRHIDLIGYDTNFSIYDSDDQKKIIKEVYKRLHIDSKQIPDRKALSVISSAKDSYLEPYEFKEQAGNDFYMQQIARIYEAYQRQLQESNALDFDDIIMKTVYLFNHHPDILDKWQERFRYIMVDEYQDTNAVQFLLVKMLAAKYRNLCVVGDDDQSIYRFRGADIRNILDFEKVYPDAVVIKLEQNYRSTKHILDVANSVIHNNVGRKDKSLWTENEDGEEVTFSQYDDNYIEADQVAQQIADLVDFGKANYSDIAVLNRTNAQSRVYEEKFLMHSIPYRIIGGVNFYARKEIKDIICYLKLLYNPADDQALKRIINVPKRGIGATTIDRLQTYADMRQVSLMDAIDMVEDVPQISAAATKKIKNFSNLIEQLRTESEQNDLESLYDSIMSETGYADELVVENTEESRARLENLEELKNKIVTFMQENEHGTLGELLEEISLIADIDSMTGDNTVVIMTIHSAKGLEFPYVFMGGMEDGVFPGYRSIGSGDMDDIEEERRLCYVGITRAKKCLHMSAARRRMQNGQIQYNPVSRFVKEIPATMLKGKKADSDTQLPDFLKPQKTIAFQSSYQLKSSPKQDTNTIFDKPSSKTLFHTNAEPLEYQISDRVRHIKFGVGTVIEIIPAGADYEVTVEFDRCGKKRMFASFARLKKED